jgi:hypothetical protein
VSLEVRAATLEEQSLIRQAATAVASATPEGFGKDLRGGPVSSRASSRAASPAGDTLSFLDGLISR